ncbi:MAG: hypothetical protein ACOYKZ_01255 [Chlamydiia bacterium]
MLKVPARTSRCQCCQKAFEGRQQVVSFLVFGEDEVLRCDVCDGCVPEAQTQMQRRAGSRPLAQWRGCMVGEEAPPQVPGALLEPLRSSGASPGLRWLLGLYLERQRLLVMQREQVGTGGGRWLELPETGECFHIMSAQPTRQDLLALQQLMVVLSTEMQLTKAGVV